MRISIHVCLAQILCAAISASAQSVSSTGSLQGLVTDQEGKPLTGAEVRYRRIFRTVAAGKRLVPAPGEAVVERTIPTDGQGTFVQLGLPVGDYLLCGTVPSLPYLDPCKWAAAVRVTVPANGSAAATLGLAKGVFLKVRINDPVRLLPREKGGAMRAGKLIVGVTFANGAYLGAESVGIDSSGRSYQMTIPAGVPLKLWLFSRDVALQNSSSGSVLSDGGVDIPFQAVAGQDQVFTFTVSGPAVQN